MLKLSAVDSNSFSSVFSTSSISLTSSSITFGGEGRFPVLSTLLTSLIYGAIDGKHIRIQKIPKSGSSNFNYKSYHSLVLMASCDADGIFTTIDVGPAGRNSDGGVFRACRLGRLLDINGFDIPTGIKLPHEQGDIQLFPYYFVADKAFPLKSYLMRPYSRRVLDNKKRIYNYRLSRGRKTIECAFGLMASKFKILSTPILCVNEETISSIIRCMCVLHNFIRIKKGRAYQPQYHKETEMNMNIGMNLELENGNNNLPTRNSACGLRDYLSNYFIQPQSALP
ncbi:hypothetical protein QTP88_000956 [Uroleucon formosanum]